MHSLEFAKLAMNIEIPHLYCIPTYCLDPGYSRRPDSIGKEYNKQHAKRILHSQR